MTQGQLERAVCRATGESRDRVRRVGFQEIRVPSVVVLPHPRPTFKLRHPRLVARASNTLFFVSAASGNGMPPFFACMTSQ